MYDLRDKIYYSIIKQFLILHQIDMAVTPMDFLGFFVENHAKFREDPNGNGELEIHYFFSAILWGSESYNPLVWTAISIR